MRHKIQNNNSSLKQITTPTSSFVDSSIIKPIPLSPIKTATTTATTILNNNNNFFEPILPIQSTSSLISSNNIKEIDKNDDQTDNSTNQLITKNLFYNLCKL
jgi:hypothetical protein